MKKYLSMAALALIAAGCSSNDENIPEPEVVNNAELIVINQRVQGIETKSVIAEKSSVSATVVMCDVANGGASSADWSNFVARTKNDPKGEGGAFANDNERATVSTASFTAVASATGGKISFNPPLYYSTTATTTSYLAAVAPTGTISEKTVQITTQDGQQDVMYAEAVSVGSTNSKIENAVLDFKHKTSQLNFNIKLEKAANNGKWTDKQVTVKSINIQQVGLPTAVDFTTGAVTWSAAADLLVPGINEVVVTADGINVGQPVMIQTGQKITINVKINVSEEGVKEYNNVVVFEAGESGAATNTQLTTEEGKSHLVTLTLKEPTSVTDATEIAANAKVTPWAVGKAGAGTLE